MAGAVFPSAEANVNWFTKPRTATCNADRGKWAKEHWGQKWKSW